MTWRIAQSQALGQRRSARFQCHGITFGGACTPSCAAGSAVTLTATPLPGLAFTGWSGACPAEPSPVCTLTSLRPRVSNAA